MTDATRIEAARALTPDGWVAPAEVVLEGNRIASVREVASTPSDLTLLPGFVDLQVNGIADVDVATADAAGYERLGELLAAQGTTTWCPTLISSPQASYEPWLASLPRTLASGPSIAGAHLEGPFLGSLPGAHPREHLRPPDLEWLSKLPSSVAVMTLGAEHRDCAEACRTLAGLGILVALGHTSPDSFQVAAAIEAGARVVTHCFNATGSIRARTPGLAGAALLDERLSLTLIADLVHVHPTLLQLAFHSKGRDRVCLITDSVAWDIGELGGESITIRDGAPRRADGTLAGTCLTMDQAIRNLAGEAGLPLSDVAHAASTSPARLLGLRDRGAIAPGLRADLVALDSELEVRGTWVGGLQVHGPVGSTSRSASRRRPRGQRAG